MIAMKKDNSDNPLVIPFMKAVRVGNFKLWRGKYAIGKGKDTTRIDCIHVSSLDGAWMIRIPETMSTYSLLVNSYATTDENLRNDFIGMVLTNYYNLTTTNSEALHDAVFFLTEMMSFPYLLLSEKDMRRRMEETMKALGADKKRRHEYIDKITDYRRQLYELIERKRASLIDDYERQQAEQRASVNENEMLRQEETAENAMDIIESEDADAKT